jgi:hypothetical protein
MGGIYSRPGITDSGNAEPITDSGNAEPVSGAAAEPVDYNALVVGGSPLIVTLKCGKEVNLEEVMWAALFTRVRPEVLGVLQDVSAEKKLRQVFDFLDTQNALQKLTEQGVAKAHGNAVEQKCVQGEEHFNESRISFGVSDVHSGGDVAEDLVPNDMGQTVFSLLLDGKRLDGEKLQMLQSLIRRMAEQIIQQGAHVDMAAVIAWYKNAVEVLLGGAMGNAVVLDVASLFKYWFVQAYGKKMKDLDKVEVERHFNEVMDAMRTYKRRRCV